MKTADVVIVGGGVVGTSIASSLSNEIKNVVLIEKEGIASQASGCNYGIVDFPRDLGFEYRMMYRTMQLYDELAENHFDIDIELEKVGGIKVAFTPTQEKSLSWYCRACELDGIPIRKIDGKEVAELEPNLNPDITYGYYAPKDTQINPYATVMAFANLAKRRGAEILTGTEVFKINVENGKVVSVDTSAGIIETRTVIVASGYMSRKLAKTAGVEVPIFPQRLQSLVTEPSDRLLTRIIQGMWDLTDEEAETDPIIAIEYAMEEDGETEEDLPRDEVEDTIFAFLKPTVAGSIVLGTTSEFVGIDRRTTPRGLTAMIRETLKICPALANAQIIRSWSGLLPFTFDFKAVLGKVPWIPGLYMAAGHPHAMSHAPAVAEIFTELIVNEKTMSENAKYVFEETGIKRFADLNNISINKNNGGGKQ